MGDDSRRRILARRAQFIAASVAMTVSSAALAADATVEDSSAEDADADSAPPEPCLSIAKDPEAEPQTCLCAIAPPETPSDALTPALVAAAGLVALRRRRA